MVSKCFNFEVGDCELIYLILVNRRKGHFPSSRKHESRSPTPRRYKRQRSRSITKSPTPKSRSPSLESLEKKISVHSFKKEEERKRYKIRTFHILLSVLLYCNFFIHIRPLSMLPIIFSTESILFPPKLSICVVLESALSISKIGLWCILLPGKKGTEKIKMEHNPLAHTLPRFSQNI